MCSCVFENYSRERVFTASSQTSLCSASTSQTMPPRPDDDDDDDDVPDEEDQDFEEEPKVDTSFKQTIIVDGLPKVPKEKHEKLINVLRKFFSQVGTIVEDGLEMPYSESGESMGCARPQLDPRRICLVLVPSSLLPQPSALAASVLLSRAAALLG